MNKALNKYQVDIISFIFIGIKNKIAPDIKTKVGFYIFFFFFFNFFIFSFYIFVCTLQVTNCLFHIFFLHKGTETSTTECLLNTSYIMFKWLKKCELEDCHVNLSLPSHRHYKYELHTHQHMHWKCTVRCFSH